MDNKVAAVRFIYRSFLYTVRGLDMGLCVRVTSVRNGMFRGLRVDREVNFKAHSYGKIGGF